MYFVYILYSKKIDQFYIGSTADIDQRVYKHNKKHRGFTAQANDWQLVYSQTYQIKTEALKRELKIKKWKSRKMIEKLISSVG